MILVNILKSPNHPLYHKSQACMMNPYNNANLETISKHKNPTKARKKLQILLQVSQAYKFNLEIKVIIIKSKFENKSK